MGRVKTKAMRTADQVRPIASTAREVASHRIEDARVWAAPRLDRAAQSVEEQIAPKVSAFLTQAAEVIDPSPSIRRRSGRARWSTVALLAGFAACAVGIVIYRNNARQWADSMKDTSADASRWSGERSEESARGMDETGATADEASRRMY
ncbi:hypothetical protein [Sphaerisporangium album]|uniref:hypothetical protein n=1 Tax=Sphaerisporangium album TaxID=509200 RepID=UPI0011C04581|nr:hypothetical protein [Sphaerisporangium album]